MFYNLSAKKILFLFVAQLILFSLGLATSARAAAPIQACRSGETRGCAIKGGPGQQFCDGAVWTACVALPPVLPNPVLAYTGAERYQANGQTWVRYKLSVTNYAAYPNSIFAAAPNLPPCGANKNSSRTWVNIDQAATNSFVYGFCAFNSAADLTSLWFAVQQGQPVPSPVKVVLVDRQLNRSYQSNSVAISVVPGLVNQLRAPNAAAGAATVGPPKVTYQIHCGFNEGTHMGECSCNQNKEGECNDMFTSYCKEGGAASCDNGKGTCSCEMKL